MNQESNNINQQNNQNLYNGNLYNLNSDQLKEVKKTSNLIPEFSNNNFNNNNNISDNNSKNNKLFKIGIILIVVVILLIVFLSFNNKKESGSSSKGYTVEKDEVLKVDELYGLYKFNMEILSIEKNYSINYMLDEINSLAVKVKITNKSDKDLAINLLQYQILDNENNKVKSVNSVSQALISDELKKLDDKEDLLPNQSRTGYLFFYDSDEEITKKINSNNISKLVVFVPINVFEENGRTHIDYEDYYFNLK